MNMRTTMIKNTFALLALTTSFALVACGGGDSSSPPPATAATQSASSSGSGSGASPATFADQVAAGQKLYTAQCASCHGSSGEGKMGPKVVGLSSGALPLDPPAGAKYRKTQFKKVSDVAVFVVKNMPADAPGSLTEDQYWSILAFDLKANGIDLGDKKLTPELAATLEIPRK
jgi:cytochrome c